MRVGSLFSGIGGLELGLERAGFGPIAWQVEIDPFPRAVLEKHWPDAVRYEDVRAVGAHNLAPVEVICGGFPCQDISVAGRGAGLSGERSGLWFEYLRVVRELRPALVIIENVAALRKRGLPVVLAGLEEAGYRSTVLDIAASDVGAPHRRKRLFIVAERVADAASGARLGRAPGHEGHAEFGGEGDGVADPARQPEREPADEAVTVATRREARHVAGRGGELADSGGPRPQGLECPREFRGAQYETVVASGSRLRYAPPQPGVGGAAHGLSYWVDGVAARSAWPSRPSEAQAPWEAPRTAANVVARGARLKGIGNAVVPQVAEAVGLWILSALVSDA